MASTADDQVTRAARALDRVHKTKRARDQADAAFRKAIIAARRVATNAEIAEAAGLSPGRISQISHEKGGTA